MKKDITELFVFVDDFCHQYKTWMQSHSLLPKRKPTACSKMKRLGLERFSSIFEGYQIAVKNVCID